MICQINLIILINMNHLRNGSWVTSTTFEDISI